MALYVQTLAEIPPLVPVWLGLRSLLANRDWPMGTKVVHVGALQRVGGGAWVPVRNTNWD